MADTKSGATQKADIKSGRRASLARALHVPAGIARHLRHMESASETGQALGSPSASPQKRGESKPEPSHSPKPLPASVSVTTRELDRLDDDAGGAEIPNIPLRRSNRALGADSALSSLAVLEKLMDVGGQEDPPSNGAVNFNTFRYEKRYDGQFDDKALYPVSERSWESSLPGVPEASSPESSFMPETSSTLDLQDQDDMKLSSPPPRRKAPVVDNRQSVELPASPVDPPPLPPSAPKMTMNITTAPLSTTATTIQTDCSEAALPPLQARRLEDHRASQYSVDEEVDDESGSFDLAIPAATGPGPYNLERRSQLLFSVGHLRAILSDPIFLHRFSSYVDTYRPQSTPLLSYALDALKAIRALDWMNEIISRHLRLDAQQRQQLREREFMLEPTPESTTNESLRQKAAAAFEALARDDLPAYITHVWTDIVEVSMRRKIMGTMPAHLQEMSEGLAEVYCITDPSRTDNPIVFASEEFHRTTQFGPDYVLGRNCRFLQGPKTNPFSVQRIREKLKQGKEHYETFLNYRRDGLPFMNLLMCTPLLDSKGNVRYFLGAQIDVSGLAKDCSGLESLRRLIDQDEAEQRNAEVSRSSAADLKTNVNGSNYSNVGDQAPPGTATTTSFTIDPVRPADKRDEFRLMAEMFSQSELDTVRRFGGRMMQRSAQQEEPVPPLETGSTGWYKPRVVLHDAYEPSPPSSPQGRELTDAQGNVTISVRPESPGPRSVSVTGANARAPAILEKYLVVRPYPSLRILFASPPLRVPGILQSHLMSRIGGSRRIHEELESAFAMGQSVTAKVKWISGTGLRSSSAGSGGQVPDSSSGGSTGSVTPTASSCDTAGAGGRPRWIHCTPLLGANGGVGVWIVVIIDEDGDGWSDSGRRRRKRTGSATSTSVSGGGGGVQKATPRSSVSGRSGGKNGDEMSLADFAAMSTEDEELRRHVLSMYKETRRRDKGAGAGREGERAWGEPSTPTVAGRASGRRANGQERATASGKVVSTDS